MAILMLCFSIEIVLGSVCAFVLKYTTKVHSESFQHTVVIIFSVVMLSMHSVQIRPCFGRGSDISTNKMLCSKWLLH